MKLEAAAFGRVANTMAFECPDSTLKRARNVVLRKLKAVKPQVKTPVRKESEGSLRNLIASFANHQAYDSRVGPALLMNTDKVGFRYNYEGDELSVAYVPKAEFLDEDEAPSSMDPQPATVTLNTSRFLPQSLSMIVTTNSLGRCGRPILLKPIKKLDKVGIVKIPMRWGFSAGASPSSFAQLWLYNPEKVSTYDTWLEYYSVVLPEFIAECRASLAAPTVPIIPVPPVDGEGGADPALEIIHHNHPRSSSSSGCAACQVVQPWNYTHTFDD